MNPVTRTALTLAALASAAIPALCPERVRQVRPRPGARFLVGFVEDTQSRRWVVRLPTEAVGAAQQDAAAGLLRLMASRLRCTVPAPAGFATSTDGHRAMVYPFLPGRPLRYAGLPAGPGLAAELGRVIADVHNIDRRIVDEAQLPSYDAAEERRRHLVDLDRAAETRRIPGALLSRWESALDDVALWRFAPTVIHGRLQPRHLLATFTDPADAATGSIGGVVGWEWARVGDPAQDFAAVLAEAPQDVVDSALEAYAVSRHEEPDPHLERRARVVAELRLLGDLLAALAAGDIRSADAAGRTLQSLAEDLAASEEAESASSGVTVQYAPEPPGEHLYRAGGEPTAPHRTAEGSVPRTSPRGSDGDQSAPDTRTAQSADADQPTGSDPPDQQPALSNPPDQPTASKQPADPSQPAPSTPPGHQPRPGRHHPNRRSGHAEAVSAAAPDVGPHG